MSINKPLFDDIYHNCSDIISKSSDNNIQKKRVKLNSAYTKLCVEENPELQEFYSIVHELRLYQYIKDLGIAINAANDEKAGPDFITDLGYIECISATKGLLGTPERQWLDKRLKESMNRYIAALSAPEYSSQAEYLYSGNFERYSGLTTGAYGSKYLSSLQPQSSVSYHLRLL